jgi:hypothetical protein
VDHGSQAAAAMMEASRPSELARTAPKDAVGRHHMATTSGWRRRRQLQPIASGLRQSDIERGVGNDQLLNIERGVSGNETSHVKDEFTGEYQRNCHGA